MTDDQPMSRRAAREAREAAAASAQPEPTAPAAEPTEVLPSTALTAAETELLASAGDGPATAASPAAEGETEAAGAPAKASPFAGIAAMVRKHPVAWMVGAGAVAFVLLGTGSVFAGAAWAAQGQAAPIEVAETDDPDRALGALDGAATRLRTCSLAAAASDPRLMTLEGYVTRIDTGEVLFDRNGTTPARTASVLKIFTAAAALATVGPDYRITTSVYEGSSPGTIVLVGRGDATLSALPAGQESYYPGAPKLQTLAEQVVAAYAQRHPGTPITSVVLDAGYWNSGDRWHGSWDRSEQSNGYQSEVTALQVDGDRADPRAATSPRSTDPIGRAGAAFVAALQAADPGAAPGDDEGEEGEDPEEPAPVDEGVVASSVSVALGSAVGSTLLGEVASQPMTALIDQMLKDSDNTLAEMIARITSKQGGMDGSAASLQRAIPGALATYGVAADGLTIVDGSGLSAQNAVPASTMTTFLAQVDGRANGLDVIAASLPIAGQSGTLAGRFAGANADARGNVTAKSGWISTAYTLAGVIGAADGTRLAFTFYAIGDGIESGAREALDTLAATAYRCGDNLSNH